MALSRFDEMAAYVLIGHESAISLAKSLHRLGLALKSPTGRRLAAEWLSEIVRQCRPGNVLQQSLPFFACRYVDGEKKRSRHETIWSTCTMAVALVRAESEQAGVTVETLLRFGGGSLPSVFEQLATILFKDDWFRFTDVARELAAERDEAIEILATMNEQAEPPANGVEVVDAAANVAATVESDGPVPPDSFILGDRRAENLRKLPYRLLELLWQQDRRLMTARNVCIKLWDDEEAESTRLRPLASRTNKRLAEYELPVTVEVKGGYVKLVIDGP